ncbi:hypothetical protein GCM10022254_09060 [Actinomadura meridiana]|uniref:Uncharacterized protein n=1 Tax=Actinomadura meridiana TaxID=559626 RepID=A0ABP8BU21_9ACTN
MSLAKTPCPTWCETDHDREQSHEHFLGEFDHVQVHLRSVSSEEYPVVWLTNGRTLRLDAPSITEIEVCEAPGMAALMDTLGHRELGEMIRDALEMVEDEDELAPVQVEGGAL